MSLITARNSVTNKVNVINIDDDGKLKIDESGIFNDTYIKLDNISNSSQSVNSKVGLLAFDITDNKTANQAIKTDLVDRRINLQYQRSLGNCFIASDENRLTTDTQAFYSLFNPSGSGKTMYIYAITFVISDHEATNIGGLVNFEYFNGNDYTKNANANDGRNMK